ncbi:MAG TPA: tail fiber domain-containing protein [Longimicrobium sp.]|nr:tail fiber domain-containing protein [Longimicrobium sp.]
MKHLISASLLALSLGLAAAPPPAEAQSDILLRLRSGSPLGDRFRVDSAGSVVAIGQLGIGIIPATGCGYRMMWYSYRASFRAGSTDDNAACNYWDDGNQGFYSWAGGNLTIASQYATFAFGDRATASASYAIAFGQQTLASGQYALAHGYQSKCQGSYCLGYGYISNANGQAAIAMGYRATADADYSVAIGQRASTNGHAGAFVFADQSTTDSVEASANNQFNARFAGGYRLFTNATETTGASMNAGGSTWNAISDRNRKEHFLSVDGEDVLSRIRGLPVTTWRYIGEENRSVRHIGPMAQDWDRAFGFSGDSTTINTGDFDGVNLAAIQALERRTAAQAAEIQSLRTNLAASREENAALRGQMESLEARLQRLEAAAGTP